MARNKSILFFLVGLVFLLPAPASAQSPQFTLLPNQRAEFRFDYLGDGSPITIAFDSPGATNVQLSLYTPAQLEANARGEIVNPVGRGAPQKNHELFWTGSFNQGGVYRAVLENKSNSAYSYRLDISGGGVKSAAPIMTPTPQPLSQVTFDGNQRVLTIPLPQGAAAPSLRLAVPNAPAGCTHANQIVQPIKQNLRLCPGEAYPALKMTGSNLVLIGDDSNPPTISSTGRQFALTIEGSNNWVEGITIQASADKLDQVAWLCLYDVEYGSWCHSDKGGEYHCSRRRGLWRRNLVERLQFGDSSRDRPRRHDRDRNEEWPPQLYPREPTERRKWLGLVQQQERRELFCGQ